MLAICGHIATRDGPFTVSYVHTSGALPDEISSPL